MAGSITLQPETLDLTLYAGDGFTFKLTVTDAASAPVNITGTVEAHVQVDRLSVDPPLAVFTADLTNAAQGIILLSLSGAQTESLMAHGSKGKFSGEWDAQWTPTGSEPRTLVQGKISCVADVTK